MTKVPLAAADCYWAAAAGRAGRAGAGDARRAGAGAAREAEQPPLCRDISGHGWLEVDLPEERDCAEESLRQGGW